MIERDLAKTLLVFPPVTKNIVSLMKTKEQCKNLLSLSWCCHRFGQPHHKTILHHYHHNHFHWSTVPQNNSSSSSFTGQPYHKTNHHYHHFHWSTMQQSRPSSSSSLSLEPVNHTTKQIIIIIRLSLDNHTTKKFFTIIAKCKTRNNQKSKIYTNFKLLSGWSYTYWILKRWNHYRTMFTSNRNQ